MKRPLRGIAPFFVLALSMLATAGRATAAPIITSANRGVLIGDANGPHPGPNTTYYLDGPFNDSTMSTLGVAPYTAPVFANQDSNIDASTGLFTGTGEANVGFQVLDSDQVLADSRYRVEFDLATAYDYTLSGLLTANMEGGFGYASFGLSGPTHLVWTARANNIETTTTVLNHTGTLMPGSYDLNVGALVLPRNANPDDLWSGNATYNFQFTLTEAVPEPAMTALLGLGLGLTGLVLAHRRRAA